MPALLQWNLKRKLMAVSLGVLLPLVAFSYYLVHENIASAKAQILASSGATADMVAYQIDDFVQSTERLLQTLAHSAILREKREWEANLLLMDAVSLSDDYLIIFATHADGRIFAAGITKGSIWDNVAKQSDLAEIVAREQTYVSGRMRSAIGDEPIANIVVTLRDQSGEAIGAVGAGVSLTKLQTRLTNRDVQRQNASVMIVDADGRALVHPDWEFVRKGGGLERLPPVREGLDRAGRGSAEYIDPIGSRRYLAAFTRASQANWVTVVAYPASLAYWPVQYATLKGLLGLALVAGLTIAAGLFLASRLSRPIVELRRKAADAIRGLPDGDPYPKSRDEMQELARAIDVMSDDLAKYAGELARMRSEIDERVRGLATLEARTLETRDEERRHLALEIHDGLAQLISAALIQSQTSLAQIVSDPEVAIYRLRATERLLNFAVAEVKRVVLDAASARLEGGLAGAVQTCVTLMHELFDVTGRLTVSGEARDLPGESEIALYRIVQESLNNARRHGGATEVEVAIDFEVDRVRIVVRDNGRGFDPRQVLASGSGGLGLRGMQQRAASIGATIQLNSAPDKGTTVTLDLPLTPEPGGVSDAAEGRAVSGWTVLPAS